MSAVDHGLFTKLRVPLLVCQILALMAKTILLLHRLSRGSFLGVFCPVDWDDLEPRTDTFDAKVAELPRKRGLS